MNLEALILPSGISCQPKTNTITLSHSDQRQQILTICSNEISLRRTYTYPIIRSFKIERKDSIFNNKQGRIDENIAKIK